MISVQELTRPIIIAGPCSAESEEQVLTTAQELSRAGVKIFRAGIWKPRTKPGGFEGVGDEGLEWLANVKQLTGMLVATEVATPEHVRAAENAGIDIFWIGARTSADPFAMQAIAETVAQLNPDKPVFVKNPVVADLDLWIGAIERLRNCGVNNVAAIHRGFRSFSSGIYRNYPGWIVPLELRRRMHDLPLICDPSHIGGARELIAPLSQKALDMGFDGLIIESHCNPEKALSDSKQQVTPEDLTKIIASLNLRQCSVMPGELDRLRYDIDQIDAELLEVLARRMEVSRKIGDYKQRKRIPVLQASRYDDLLVNRIAAGSKLGLDGKFIEKIFSAIHEESVNQQLS
ncbi:MAG: bifunctional 3-deoxy-7-phosphoheptulonate synthase/chorismate mutase type II [Lachnoclostridium sp.]|nr:bifunctional 3-deoxy-7-phosphoheptulonate synthase/chorismate mutase type II [Lachnoclostridium sp.]